MSRDQPEKVTNPIFDTPGSESDGGVEHTPGETTAKGNDAVDIVTSTMEGPSAFGDVDPEFVVTFTEHLIIPRKFGVGYDLIRIPLFGA